MAVVTYREALNQALDEEMARDPDVFLMGEEVGVYNGAYKVSKGLLDKYGEMRVVDTPITELGFAGLGVGAAMTGIRPVIEFMTWNFAILAFDQIFNSAAKLRSMSGGQFRMPLTFRGPTGAALQLAAQHSQALESQVAHYPGVKVVVPGTPADAKGLLKAAIRDDDPVLFFEHKWLYRRPQLREVLPREDYVVPIGKARTHREGKDLTIVTYAALVHKSQEAAEVLEKEDGLDVEIIDLRTILPLDDEAIIQSVKKTNRLLIVHEDTRTGGIAGEIAMRVSEKAFEWLDAPIQRVTALDAPIPYSPPLEDYFLPQTDDIVKAARWLAKY